MKVGGHVQSDQPATTASETVGRQQRLPLIIGLIMSTATLTMVPAIQLINFLMLQLLYCPFLDHGSLGITGELAWQWVPSPGATCTYALADGFTHVDGPSLYVPILLGFAASMATLFGYLLARNSQTRRTDLR